MRREEGFTLIELMVVTIVLGVLVAIAFPVFAGARSTAARKACYSNERIVEGACNQYISTHDTASFSDWSHLMSSLVPTEVAVQPSCPEGGTYTWQTDHVVCSVHGTYRDGH